MTKPIELIKKAAKEWRALCAIPRPTRRIRRSLFYTNKAYQAAVKKFAKGKATRKSKKISKRRMNQIRKEFKGRWTF
jgi:hypothetical protein